MPVFNEAKLIMVRFYLQINTWKNVELRSFDVTRYPAHVSQLWNKAFKPLIIQVP